MPGSLAAGYARVPGAKRPRESLGACHREFCAAAGTRSNGTSPTSGDRTSEGHAPSRSRPAAGDRPRSPRPKGKLHSETSAPEFPGRVTGGDGSLAGQARRCQPRPANSDPPPTGPDRINVVRSTGPAGGHDQLAESAGAPQHWRAFPAQTAPSARPATRHLLAIGDQVSLGANRSSPARRRPAGRSFGTRYVADSKPAANSVSTIKPSYNNKNVGYAVGGGLGVVLW